MRISSHDKFTSYKLKVNEKLAEFESKFENTSKRKKKLLHYHSTINLGKGIIRYNNTEADKLKDLFIEYLELVKHKDLSIDKKDSVANSKQKMESIDLFNKYLSPVGSYMILKDGYGIDQSAIFTFVLGLIIDLLLFFFVLGKLIAFFTIIFPTISIIRRNKRRANGKVYGMFY